jgi:hypothetical protein
MQLIRDLYYLARETVGVISEGFALGLKVIRDESPGRDEITHGPKWITQEAHEAHTSWLDYMLHWPNPFIAETASTDGAVTDDPPVERSPAAAVEATSAAAGHPNGWAGPILDLHDGGLLKLEWVAAFGLRQWLAGETCDAPTFFESIAHDLEQLSK